MDEIYTTEQRSNSLKERVRRFREAAGKRVAANHQFDYDIYEPGHPLPETLKPDINAFLWTRLPDSTTIKRADEIACAVHDLIFGEWERDTKQSAIARKEGREK